jgi:hypothetical protein
MLVLTMTLNRNAACAVSHILQDSVKTLASNSYLQLRHLANINLTNAKHSSQKFRTKVVHWIWWFTEHSDLLLQSNNILVFFENMIPNTVA